MINAIKDATTVKGSSIVGKKRGKPKALSSSAIDAGLAALDALDSCETAIRPVVPTARTFVAEGIERIMKLRAKGVPLLRIYTDAKRAARLTISFQTFAGYVCSEAKARGIKLEKPMPWNCPACAEKSVRTEKDGRAWWHCPACRMLYADDNGKVSQKRLAKKEGNDGKDNRPPCRGVSPERPGSRAGTPETGDPASKTAVQGGTGSGGSGDLKD